MISKVRVIIRYQNYIEVMSKVSSIPYERPVKNSGICKRNRLESKIIWFRNPLINFIKRSIHGKI